MWTNKKLHNIFLYPTLQKNYEYGGKIQIQVELPVR